MLAAQSTVALGIATIFGMLFHAILHLRRQRWQRWQQGALGPAPATAGQPGQAGAEADAAYEVHRVNVPPGLCRRMARRRPRPPQRRYHLRWQHGTAHAGSPRRGVRPRPKRIRRVPLCFLCFPPPPWSSRP